MAKVGDAHIDVHADTKKAQDDIDKLSKRIEKAGPGLNRFGDYMSFADRAASSLSRRLKSGFSTGYAAAVARGENSFIQLGNALEVAGAGFKKIDNESTVALKRFQSLQRRAYSLQSAIGVLGGGIGDLAGGFLALVGVAGQAAYSLVAIGSAVSSVVAGFIVTSFATKGVGRALGQLTNNQGAYSKALRDTKRELRDLRFELEETVLSEQEAAIELEKARTELAMAQDLPPDNMVRREAELAYQRADLNYRKTKARLKDVQDEIKRGGNAVQTLAAANPFKDLTKSQIAFTKYLFSIKPLLATLKEAASSSFLPPLTEGIQTLVSGLLPSLQRGFRLLGAAMGSAAKSFANIITKPENVKLLDEFFKGSVPTLEALGRVAGNTFAGILGLLKAAQPLTDRFVGWLERVSKSFEETVKSPSYQKFLTLAGDVAASLGKVIGTFSDGIGNLMRATFAPGGAGYVLIDWLQGIAQGFKDFTGSADFPKFLKDSTTNATLMLSVIGDFLGIFLKLAGAPETRDFFQILKKSIPDITKIFMDGVKAAPAFAGLIVSIVEMFALLSDSGALKSFFTTLKVIADMFNGLLKVIKPFLDAIGTVHGAFLAISLTIGILGTGFMIFFALLGRIVKGFGQMFQGISAVLNAMTRYNQTLAASGTAGGKMEQQLARQPGLFDRIRMAVAKHTMAMQSSRNVYKEVPSVMSQYRVMLDRLNTRTAANRESLKQQGAGFALLTSNIKIHTTALKLAVMARRADMGILKLHRQAIRTVYDAVKQEVIGTRNSTVAKKEHTSTLKRHSQALKAALFGTKEANNEEKKAPGALKLVAAGYNSVKTSIGTYRDSLRQLKRTRQDAADAAKLETTATKAATAEYVRGATAAKQYASSKKFVGLNNAQTGMMGMGGGAGTKILGGAMVAQGLIGAATDTGNQAGNFLATLGGAAMFSGNPYLMGAGAVASIAGTAINAINAAEDAKKQQKLSVLAERVQLDAQVVNQAGEVASAELFELLKGDKFTTFKLASDEVSRRVRAAADIAAATGADPTKLESVRLSLQAGGVAPNSQRMDALLKAAGVSLATDRKATADSVSQSMLAVLNGPGGLTEVLKRFGTAPTDAAGRRLFFETQTREGSTTAGLVAAGETAAGQKKRLREILKSPESFSILKDVAPNSRLGRTKLLDPKLLAGIDSSVIKEAFLTKFVQGLSVENQEILRSVSEKRPAQLENKKLNGFLIDTFTETVQTQPTRPFNFSTGTFGSPLTRGGLSMPDITKLQGAPAKPGIYTSIVPDLTAVASQKEYDKKTLTALQALEGVIEDGKLKIIDADPKDRIAPVLIPSANATTFEREQIKLINAELVKAFAK